MNVYSSKFEDGSKIVYQETGKIAIVTINREHVRNAMTPDMWLELANIARTIEGNGKARVVILRGKGKNFTVGSDLKAFHKMGIEEANQAFAYMEEAISAFEHLRLPVIGVVTGPALGAGFQLALACDIRIGTPEALMGMPIARLGITLSHKFTQRIVNLIGPSRTKDFVFTSRYVKGEEAYQLGLLNYLVSEEELDDFVLKIADKIRKAAPSTLITCKEAVAQSNPFIEVPFYHRGYPQYVDRRDFPEGVAAFVEKREPNFE